jgi:hypothetical protein
VQVDREPLEKVKRPLQDIMEGKVNKYKKGEGSTILEEEEESNDDQEAPESSKQP